MANDMEANLLRVRAVFHPEGPGRDVPHRSSGELFSDDIHVYFQGRSWALGGHHYGREGLERFRAGCRKIWPEPSRFGDNRYWLCGDTVAIEWFSTNETWKARPNRNSGVSFWKFRDDQVVDWREYTDTEFFASEHAGWREQFGEEFGKALPNWPKPAMPMYSRAEDHEWSFDTADVEGEPIAPPGMKASLETMRGIFDPALRDPGRPRKPSNRATFTDDIRISFQGRDWGLGGHHHGREGLNRFMDGCRKLWGPTPSEFVKTSFFVGEDSIVMEWHTRGVNHRGQPLRNSGVTIWNWRADQVYRWREYTDTEYLAEVMRGWRQVMGEEFGGGLPNWPEPGDPKYPDPHSHE